MTDMNVYMLKMHFSPETAGEPASVQRDVENAIRGVLKGSFLINQFSRVSEPYADTGLMAIICSEEVAETLRAKNGQLGIDTLVLDEGRTERRQKAQSLRETHVNYLGALRLVARI